MNNSDCIKHNCCVCGLVVVHESNNQYQHEAEYSPNGLIYCFPCAVKECETDIEFKEHLGLDENEN